MDVFLSVTDVTDLLLPPAFEPVVVRTDAFAAAVKAVEGDADQGNFFWVDSPSLFDAALVWAPEFALSRMWPARCVTMLAMAEALGSLGPPNIPVTFSWPDVITVNGATAGGVRVASPQDAGPETVPDWLVVGLTLRLSYPPGTTAPGLTPDQTALLEEGFGEVTANELAEAFARNILYWIHQWTEVGPRPVAAHWLAHLDPAGATKSSLDLSTGDLLRSGPDGGSLRHPLPPAGDAPGWSLDVSQESSR